VPPVRCALMMPFGLFAMPDSCSGLISENVVVPPFVDWEQAAARIVDTPAAPGAPCGPGLARRTGQAGVALRSAESGRSAITAGSAGKRAAEAPVGPGPGGTGRAASACAGFAYLLDKGDHLGAGEPRRLGLGGIGGGRHE